MRTKKSFKTFIGLLLILLSISEATANICFAEVLPQKEETAAVADNAEQEDVSEQSIAEKLADELIEAAVRAEPEVTALLLSFESENARLVGLEHRIKSKESLTRKILTDAHDMEVSPEEAAGASAGGSAGSAAGSSPTAPTAAAAARSPPPAAAAMYVSSSLMFTARN